MRGPLFVGRRLIASLLSVVPQRSDAAAKFLERRERKKLFSLSLYGGTFTQLIFSLSLSSFFLVGQMRGGGRRRDGDTHESILAQHRCCLIRTLYICEGGKKKKKYSVIFYR